MTGPNPEVFARNLEALQAISARPITLPLRSEPSRVRLHSERAPFQEAERWLAYALGAAPAPAPPLVVVIGLGLGYVLDVLEQRAPETRVLAFEPLADLLPGFLARRDWRGWIQSGRLRILIGPDYAGGSDAWRMVDPPGADPPVIEHPVLAREYPGEMSEARGRWQRILFDARANAEARKENAGRYLLNTLRNLPVIAREGDVASLTGRFAGAPAVIVGAGPSLDDVREDLIAITDRALLIAVDTAVRPLHAMGIEPTLVVALDPTTENARHLIGLPALERSWLVAEPSVDPAAFIGFAGRTFTFTLGFEPWPWLQTLGLGRGPLDVWGSVATAAFDLALRLGCDPIVFTGLDLAYTHDQPYCRGTINEEDWAAAVAWGDSLPAVWERAISRRTVVTETDAVGQPCRTAPHLVAFRDWIVERASSINSPPGAPGAGRDRRVINASAGIVHGGGIEQQRLRDAVPDGTGFDAARAIETVRAAHRASASGVPVTLQSIVADVAADADTAGGPVPAWREFAVNTVTGAEIVDVLKEALDDLRSPPARVDERPIWVPTPEQVLLFRALLAGTVRVKPGIGIALPQEAAEALAKALDAVTTAVHPSAQTSHVDPWHVPASELFVWEPVARREVLWFEGALAEAIRLRPVQTTGSAFWGRHVEPVVTGNSEEAEATTTPDAARLALAREWILGRLALTDADASISRLVMATRSPLTPDAQAAEYSHAGAQVHYSLRLPPASAHRGATSMEGMKGWMPAYRVMRAYTGALSPYRAVEQSYPANARHTLRMRDGLSPLDVAFQIRPGAAPDPRLPLLAQVGASVEPIVLTELGLPHCFFGVTSGASGVLSAFDQICGYRIDEDGAFDARPAWPRPLFGELPWGDTGGAVAWHNGLEPYVMIRRAAGADAELIDVPFRGSCAASTRSGTVVWASRFGGLWQWSPESGVRKLAEAPNAIGVRVLSEGIRLDPWTSDERGATRRVPSDHAWLWREGSTQLEPIALGSEGQSWSIASANGWTAQAFPHGDLVRFTDDAGGTIDLACYYPITVAWAGRSLVVVSSTSGDVLFFHHLAATLEAIKARGDVAATAR